MKVMKYEEKGFDVMEVLMQELVWEQKMAQIVMGRVSWI